MIQNDQDNYENLALLSKRGFLGEIIPEHRALLSSSLPRTKWLAILCIPVVFNFLILNFINDIGQAWLAMFDFWFEKLNILGEINLATLEFFGVKAELPKFDIPSSAPDATIWWILTALTAMLFGMTHRLPKRLMPLFYMVYFVAIFLSISLIYFAAVPARFPYTVSGYLDNLLITAIWLMLVIPWIHALIYYIFDFSLIKKLGLTLLSIAFIAIAMPFQLLAQMVILVNFSVILLPILYVFFGIFLLILCCLSLYGWAMSWEKSR